MSFNSFSDFLAMGHHALYVWTAYGICLAVIAYMLTVALLIPASGWIADRFGTKKIFFGAIMLFSIGSLLFRRPAARPIRVRRIRCFV